MLFFVYRSEVCMCIHQYVMENECQWMSKYLISTCDEWFNTRAGLVGPAWRKSSRGQFCSQFGPLQYIDSKAFPLGLIQCKINFVCRICKERDEDVNRKSAQEIFNRVISKYDMSVHPWLVDNMGWFYKFTQFWVVSFSLSYTNCIH